MQNETKPRSTLSTICLIISLISAIILIGFTIWGLIMFHNLNMADYQAQIEQFGFYKEDVHVLPDYLEVKTRCVWLIGTPAIVTGMFGILSITTDR